VAWLLRREDLEAMQHDETVIEKGKTASQRFV